MVFPSLFFYDIYILRKFKRGFSMIRIAICDDEVYYREQFLGFVQKYAMQNKSKEITVFTFTHAEELMEEVSKNFITIRSTIFCVITGPPRTSGRGDIVLNNILLYSKYRVVM